MEANIPLPEMSTTQSRCGSPGRARFERDDVVVVAADLFGLPVSGRDFRVQQLRQRGGEELLLDGRGHGELFFHLLLDERFAEMPGIVESNGGLRHQTGSKFQVGFRVGGFACAGSADHQAAGVAAGADGKQSRTAGDSHDFAVRDVRVGEVGDCLPIGNVGRDVEAALAQGEGMPAPAMRPPRTCEPPSVRRG